MITRKELLRTAFPLMAASFVGAVNQIVDRFFLGQFSDIALEAIIPALILSVVFSCMVVAIVSYSGTFVAHYYGERKHVSAIRSLAQGLWLSLSSIPFFLLAIPVGNAVLSTLGHPTALLEAERTYFDIVVPSCVFTAVKAVLAGYLIAERKTAIVGVACVAGCLTNMALAPILIFGWLGVPAGGIAGAAVATLLSTAVPSRRWLNGHWKAIHLTSSPSVRVTRC